MIQILKDMDMPDECHECPFQLRFKDGEVEDGFYMRRCVIENRIIEYPRPGWCPIRSVTAKTSEEDEPHKVSMVVCLNCGKRWVAVRPLGTKLTDLECPQCRTQGAAIETGEELEDDGK
jgi:hypothetical protein